MKLRKKLLHTSEQYIPHPLDARKAKSYIMSIIDKKLRGNGANGQ
jgi:hypothetical protein